MSLPQRQYKENRQRNRSFAVHWPPRKTSGNFGAVFQISRPEDQRKPGTDHRAGAITTEDQTNNMDTRRSNLDSLEII